MKDEHIMFLSFYYYINQIDVRIFLFEMSFELFEKKTLSNSLKVCKNFLTKEHNENVSIIYHLQYKKCTNLNCFRNLELLNLNVPVKSVSI